MKPGYHATHLIQDQKLLMRIPNGITSEDAKILADKLEGIKRATKFVCPSDGRFFDDDRFDRYWQFLRLPFKEIVLEYDCGMGRYRQAFPSDVSICLYAREIEFDGGGDGCAISVAIKDRAPNHGWVMLPSEIFLPYGLDPKEMESESWTPDEGPRYKMFAPSILSKMYDKVSPEEAAESVYKIALFESISLLQFCAAMACSNVRYEEIRAPKFINSKRVARGEVPFFEYKVLTVDVSKRNERGDPLGGTHASPRQHLRRGHIRRYRSGLTIWINAMTVGRAENGSVDKDYMVAV